MSRCAIPTIPIIQTSKPLRRARRAADRFVQATPPLARLNLSLAIHLGLAAAAMLVPGWSGPAHAQGVQQRAAETARHYDIPAGPLDQVLGRFAGQSGVLLAASSPSVLGRSSPGLKGRYTPEAALGALLAGTGLQAMQQADGSFALRQIAAGPTSSTPVPGRAQRVSLPAVTVTADALREVANGPVLGTAATRSATATKTDTPLLETAQSISVLGRAEMVARGDQSVMDALPYVPGVMSSHYGHDDRGWEWFSIRGFGNSYNPSYLDGLRQAAGGYTVPHNEAYGLERVEVLRGPSSVLYGQGDAGGLVSRISKRPHADATREVALQWGNFGHRQAAADLGGALDEQGKAAWRLVALGTSRRPQNDYPGFDDMRGKRSYLAPSLALKPSADTSVVLLAELLAFRTTTNATEYLGPDLQRTRVLTGAPNHDLHDQRQWSVGYQIEHRVSPNWTLRQNLRTSGVELDTRYVVGFGHADAAGDFVQDAYSHNESLRYTAVDSQLQGRFDTGGVGHTLLVGIDWFGSRLDARVRTGPGPTLNVLHPVYGAAVADPTTAYQDQFDKQRQIGVYLQDQIRFAERWRLTAGLRHDRARTHSEDRLAGTLARSRDAATTARLGLSYVLKSGLAPYASYAQSFLPQIGSDFSGKRFDPTRGRQYEIGLKYQPAGSDGLATLALFDLSKTHIQTPDPEHRGHNLQIGAARSRGLEFEIKQKFRPGLALSAQYTYLDTRITKSHGVDLGKRLPRVPKQLAAVWLDYQIQEGDWRGAGLGLGVRYTGKRYDDAANSLVSPAITLVDMALRYELGPWTAAVHIHNLFDKDYLASVVYGGYPGTRRTAVLSAKYRF